MKSSQIVKHALESYNENELIFANKLYKEKLANDMSEAAFYKTLERMYKSESLGKIAKGTYYIPKSNKYGLIPPSTETIIKTFTKNCTGTVIGYTLYNTLNLTTQISKSVEVLSSELDEQNKSFRDVMVRRVYIDYSTEIQNMIHVLEVLQHFNEIQDINYCAFIKYTKNIARNYNDDVFKTVFEKIHYKKSTIAFLREILNFYNVENNLNEYLSALSKYKYPNMEELYGLA